jgi:CRISPR-associated protein Csd2
MAMQTKQLIDPAAAIKKRYDFLYIFDVKDGNPNGDPDFDNTPRFDPETFQGLVSDVCLKRKIRDYVYYAKESDGQVEQGYDIFVRSGTSLENQQRKPYDVLPDLKGKEKAKETKGEDIELARQWMCVNFFDVRAFGAVMSTTEFRCGQVRGPVQLTFARSHDRVFASEHGITRVAYTTEEKRKSTSATTEMGNKKTVAYGLYLAHGFISPQLARATGFNDADLEVIWQALNNMFEFDRSAARGLMAARHLFVFEHESPLGNAPAHRLFELIENRLELKEGVETPRAYKDYVIPSVADIRPDLPAGVNLRDLVVG